MRSAMSVVRVFAPFVVFCGLPAGFALAQKSEITVEYILSTFKPQYADIDIDTPDKKDWAQCKVEIIDGKSGYLVLGPVGQPLRKFLDTNDDGKTDQWGYFSNGLEVYRELDTNGNKKIDQVRWLNLGGTRWGVDADEDGKIEEWKSISAEETSRVAIRALVAQDIDLLTPLLVNKDDLQSLGIKGSLGEKLLASVDGAESKLEKASRTAKVITPKTVWRRFDSSGPGVIPAETHKTKGDLFVTENAMAFVDFGDAKKQGLVVLGEMLRVGNAWKLTTIPAPTDPEGNVELPGGIVMYESSRGGPAAAAVATTGDVPEKLTELFKRLRELQDGPPTANATKSEWEKHYKELDKVLVLLFNDSTTDADREQWVRQLLDTINAGVQAGHYPQGMNRLKELERDIKKAFPKLAAFAEYRRTWAEYTLAMRATEDDEDRGKVHSQWLKDLEKFLEKYPKSEDSAEVALQLGFEFEFAGKVEKARGWYQKVSTSFPTTEAARRADGALLRLGLNGKVLAISGAPLAGGAAMDSKQFRGKTLLVLFWDTRSKPAAEDLPALKELYEQYHAKNFEILGVNLDPEKDLVNGFIKQRGIPWPQIHEEGGLESAPARKFGIITLPTMFLVDPDGKVISRSASVDDVREQLTGQKSK